MDEAIKDMPEGCESKITTQEITTTTTEKVTEPITTTTTTPKTTTTKRTTTPKTTTTKRTTTTKPTTTTTTEKIVTTTTTPEPEEIGPPDDECSGTETGGAQNDVRQGQELQFSCGSGCIKITKAVYSCQEDMNTPVQAHMDLLKEKCDGKSSCVAQSCHTFWNAEQLTCEGGAPPKIWVNFKLTLYWFRILFHIYVKVCWRCLNL